MATTPVVIDPNAADINVDDLTGLVPVAGPDASSLPYSLPWATSTAGTTAATPASTGVSPWLWIVMIGAGLLLLDSMGKK
jgi:hypothetical protein